MTSTPVNVQGFATNSMYSANRMQATETKGDFSKIFENQKNVSNDVGETECVERDIQEEPQTEKTKPNEDVAEVNRAETEEKNTSVEETVETEQPSDYADKGNEELDVEQYEQLASVLNGAVLSMKEMLMNQLQLSESELEQLLQELDMTDLDLLQLDNVKAVVLQAMGTQDVTDVLTNEELYAQLKSVESEFADIIQNVQETLDVSVEDARTVVEQTEEYQDVKNTVAEKPINIEMKADVQEPESTELPQVEKQEGSAKEQNPMQENNAFAEQQMMKGNVETVQSTSTAQTASYVTAETENIMRQIMDHMRIQLTADATELDMQLQPETLGTLQIKISAKEGVMTAQFTTTSESVRGMLESQMIQLQQQFEQQNIKVEAIEVTVQAHAFESALEKGNEHQSSGEEPKKNRTRRIDLLHLNGTEELETEEKLLAEMMEANGNTVDYLA